MQDTTFILWRTKTEKQGVQLFLKRGRVHRKKAGTKPCCLPRKNSRSTSDERDDGNYPVVQDPIPIIHLTLGNSRDSSSRFVEFAARLHLKIQKGTIFLFAEEHPVSKLGSIYRLFLHILAISLYGRLQLSNSLLHLLLGLIWKPRLCIHWDARVSR